jgi:retron-type reverse transcriptase
MSYFNSIDHQILESILKEHIHDQQFIDLYWKFVRAGYMVFGKMKLNSVGVPQGSIISPILSNIYLDKFDKYVEQIKEELESQNKGKPNMVNPEYAKLDNTIQNITKSKARYKRLGKI